MLPLSQRRRGRAARAASGLQRNPCVAEAPDQARSSWRCAGAEPLVMPFHGVKTTIFTLYLIDYKKLILALVHLHYILLDKHIIVTAGLQYAYVGVYVGIHSSFVGR